MIDDFSYFVSTVVLIPFLLEHSACHTTLYKQLMGNGESLSVEPLLGKTKAGFASRGLAVENGC